MIGGVTRLGGLPALPRRLTLSAGVAFCHVNDSRWGNPQREQIMRVKEHWPPKCVVRPTFSLFTCQATTQQRLVTSSRDPRVVVSLHVNTGHFSTTARQVTSPTSGPPLPCKRALRYSEMKGKKYSHLHDVKLCRRQMSWRPELDNERWNKNRRSDPKKYKVHQGHHVCLLILSFPPLGFYVFPRLASKFSRAWLLSFPALGTGYMFSRAWHRPHIFPLLARLNVFVR